MALNRLSTPRAASPVYPRTNLGFLFLKNDGALLSWAVWNYAREFFLKKNFTPFIAPAIVKKEYFFGTGHLPGGADDLYVTQDGDYLSGTAEVPMMAYHADEILKKEELPKRYLAFSKRAALTSATTTLA